MSNKRLTHQEVERQVQEALNWTPPVPASRVGVSPGDNVKRLLRQRLTKRR